ncbi:NADH dehydrogenase (quinone) subunit D [candidate division CSSED10-310 bacterium]|uniref:NADH dehydrogenase (Quinone) subunit D n=1 Tax=candidate division CSSED10-310 bacterium TaxID=2855610 RepID=A0ABV6Z2R9_UNCC1
MSETVLTRLKERFEHHIIQTSADLGDDTAIIQKDKLLPIIQFLKSDPELDFNVMTDLCGVDYLDRTERFEVVYNLYSLSKKHRIRLKVQLRESDCTVSSIQHLYPGANWAEREAWDLYGIHFKGHPNLRRILTHDEFVGHALRKDYPIEQGQWLSSPSELTDFSAEMEQYKDDLSFDLLPLNIGPSHPAMHGALRVKVLLNGEVIVNSVSEIGYLHRAFEKSAETHTYTQVIPYTDRLNYCSALLNNVGYCFAVEKLMEIEITPRAKVIRVIISELSRIMDHLVCIGAQAVDVGALTNFWYYFNVREKMYDLVENLCGARLTNSYTRIGGLSRDLPAGFTEDLKTLIETDLDQAIKDVSGLLEKNRIFIDRTAHIGAISATEAIGYGYTGPCLRACGVNYDIRKVHPYYDYDSYDFEIPLGTNGDTYDRMMVRFEEMRQSARIILQALQQLPEGPINISDPRVTLPDKQSVYNTIEGMMNHFKLIYEGIQPPEGDVYGYIEGANGELGFYIVSDGTSKPYRIKVRPPCFYIFESYDHLIKNVMVADAISILGSLNIIAGELDR